MSTKINLYGLLKAVDDLLSYWPNAQCNMKSYIRRYINKNILLYEELFARAPPANKNKFAGAPPANKIEFVGAALVNKNELAGVVL